MAQVPCRRLRERHRAGKDAGMDSPPTPRFSIAPFVPADLTAVSDLWVATWAKAMPDIDFEARRPWFHGHLEALQAGGAQVLVARSDADTGGLNVAGFVAIHPRTRYLDQLAVAPAFWGSGAAAALMAAARERSPEGIDLDVNQDNPRAVAFYQRYGFKIAAAATNPTSGRAIWRMEWRPG